MGDFRRKVVIWYNFLMTDDFEYLATYSTRTEAESIKGLLESNGIKCLLQFDETGDVLGGVGVNTGPTEVYVAPGDLTAARNVADVKKEV